jgi:hypothetical protein
MDFFFEQDNFYENSMDSSPLIAKQQGLPASGTTSHIDYFAPLPLRVFALKKL